MIDLIDLIDDYPWYHGGGISKSYAHPTALSMSTSQTRNKRLFSALLPNTIHVRNNAMPAVSIPPSSRGVRIIRPRPRSPSILPSCHPSYYFRLQPCRFSSQPWSLARRRRPPPRERYRSRICGKGSRRGNGTRRVKLRRRSPSSRSP